MKEPRLANSIEKPIVGERAIKWEKPIIDERAIDKEKPIKKERAN